MQMREMWSRLAYTPRGACHMPEMQKSLLESAKTEERFWAKVRKTDGCWEWLGSTTGGHRPYGNLTVHQKSYLAHRVSYEANRGRIPPGFVIDHLCRNRLCVKPSHMEAVTQRQNILRGTGIAAKKAAASSCPKGHPYNLFNTETSHGCRRCHTCRLEVQRRYRSNKRHITEVPKSLVEETKP